MCSRCFPGIEPEYKSLVFSKVKPIFDFIAVQEQGGDAQKDAEWLAAEERRLRHGHLKHVQPQTQTQSSITAHSGPVIGKDFIADSRPLRQTSRSPAMPSAYTREMKPHDFPTPFMPYTAPVPQNHAMHQGVPALTAFGSIYPYNMIQPQPFQRYDRPAEEYAFRPAVQHEHMNQYSFQKSAVEPAPSIQAASSSRFSMVESSESASEPHLSPFSKSGSQHTIPRLGFTVTEASSVGSIQSAGTASTGRSFLGEDRRHWDLPKFAGDGSRDCGDVHPAAGVSGAEPNASNPFSPFGHPQLLATQASQVRQRSARKAELLSTRSISPIGHEQTGSPVEVNRMQDLHADTFSASNSQESMKSATFSSEASYVNALGSLLKDVHL